MARGTTGSRAELVISLGVLLLGIGATIVAWRLPEAGGYARIGPNVVPKIVSAGLILLGVWLLAEVFTGGCRARVPDDPAERGEHAFLWSAFAWVSAGLFAQMALIHTAGFVIAAAVLFACVARGFGSTRWLRDRGHRAGSRSAGFSVLRTLPECQSACGLVKADPRWRGHMTETFNALLTGFGVALQPINLLWGFVGVTLGTAIGVLPGVGPALTVAMLLPLTVKLDPTGALIMFAGIYYGAMYGGSTTTILLNTPGESASIATALEGNKMARTRSRRPGAGDRRDRFVRGWHDRDPAVDGAGADRGRSRVEIRSGRILCVDGVRVRHGRGGAGQLDRARTDDAVHGPAARSGRYR